ncbi:MAG: hypothetical protein E7516_06095 [Ruminococcaceae bacterium]|nr:hypothetical protein [Oscillospiraceae bacterium]
MFNFLYAILAFFFSISSFFTVLFGNNLCTLMVTCNEERGYVWECDIEDDSIAVVKSEKTGSTIQTFVLEGISEGQTEVTLTNKRGETTQCIIYSAAEINPYNGKTEFYQIYVLYDFGTYIGYDEGITLTAETPVEGGYWSMGLSDWEPALASDPQTINGVCTFDVINTSMTDEKYATLFTYYDKDGTPLETQFKAYTLKKDGTISYTDESRLAKVELPADFSKLEMWRVAEDNSESNAAEIINIYLTSDTYGSVYLPENIFSSDLTAIFEELLGKVPVDGTSTVVIEALKEGTAEFKLEKLDMYPIIADKDGFYIDMNRCEVIETVTVSVTVDADLNITYEIK